MKFFKKKETTDVMKLDPTAANPTTAQEYLARGWAYHVRKQYESAETDFLKAVELDGGLLDGYFALALTHKALGKKDDAIKNLEYILDSLGKEGAGVDDDRNSMMRRLVKGHINELKDGDWNLEKEIWKRE